MKNFKSLCMRFQRTWFVVMFLALSSMLLFAASSAHAVNLVTESFTGATAPYANWPISGTGAAFITATQADATSGTVVQLTPATNDRAGTLVYDKAFSSALGATVTLNYFMGGGTGADGFSVFLVDGTTTSVTAGKSGGTLGYGTNYTSINGVPNAYTAVGFDVYGNCIVEFGNAAGTGINNGARTENNVCIGGSGNLLSGYRYLTGSVQANIGHATAWRKAEVIVKRGDGTNGCANGGVCLSVRFSTDNGTTWTTVYTDYRVDNATGQAAIPDTFKIGFSGSTGGSNNKHYIDNVQIDLTGAQLDVLKAGTGTGTVTSTSNPTQTTQFNCGATCAVAYPGATVITLTATPSASSNFTSWSGGTGDATCTGTGTCAVTLNANSSVTANFALNTYTVTANASGNGTGTVASNTGGISYTYQTNNTGTTSALNYGTSVTLTATAGIGSTVSWTTCTGTTGGTTAAATCTFSSLDGNKTAQATFTLNTYTVTTTATNGTITSTNNPTVNHGSTTTVTGSATTGYYFAGVSGCGGTTQSNTNQSITTFSYTTGAITAACTVSATFTETFTETCTYSISPSRQSFDSSGGTGSVRVTATEGCTWTAASNASWAGITSGNSGSGNGTVSFAVSANAGASRTGSLTIAGSTFRITQSGLQYTLVVTKSGTGTGSIYKIYGLFNWLLQLLCGNDCQVNMVKYDIGTHVFLYAVPESGTTFIGWSGGGCSGTGICTVTLNENISVNAAFSPVSGPVTDSATTTLATTGNDIYVNVPVIEYVNNADSTTTYYYAEFVYVPTVDNNIWLKLTKADVIADVSQYNGAKLSQLYSVGNDWIFHLTTVEYDGASVWADLKYIPSNDGILWVVITGSGTN